MHNVYIHTSICTYNKLQSLFSTGSPGKKVYTGIYTVTYLSDLLVNTKNGHFAELIVNSNRDIRIWFRLGTGRMPQVKGQALHVCMHNRGDNIWFTCVRWCTRCKALTQLQTALQYHTMGYGLIPRPSTC